MSKQPYRIMIDPGHGGHDPGAISPHFGIAEKEIVLRMALMFRDYISESDYLYDVLLTREEDIFIPLQKRCDKANDATVDLFVSFHCNASENQSAKGIEVFFYAGSEQSKLLAAEVYRDLLTMIEGHDGRGIKEGKYYVLKFTKMPAILIEFEFLSNEEQAQFLADKDNQMLMIQSVADTVEYFLEGGDHE